MGWHSNIYLAIVINDQQDFDLNSLKDILHKDNIDGKNFDKWCGIGNLEICTDVKTSVLFKEYDEKEVVPGKTKLVCRKFLISTNIKYGTDGDLEYIINSLIKYKPGLVYMKGIVQGEDIYAECNLQECTRSVSNKVFWLEK